MKNLYILLLIAAVPGYVSAATYTNKTGHPLFISKINPCDEKDVSMTLDTSLNSEFMDVVPHEIEVFQGHEVMMDEECVDGQCHDSMVVDDTPCTKTISIELLPHESAVFENEQDQPVTITSPHLNEKREFFPTNDSFNYEITISKFSSKFSKLTINHAQ